MSKETFSEDDFKQLEKETHEGFLDHRKEKDLREFLFLIDEYINDNLLEPKESIAFAILRLDKRIQESEHESVADEMDYLKKLLEKQMGKNRSEQGKALIDLREELLQDLLEYDKKFNQGT